MVKTNRSCVCLVMLIVSLAAQTELFSQQAKFKDLKFSKEEVELLKRWKQIEDGATIASSMLKATPFVELFTATKPHEQLVTVTMNDWDLIGAAIKGLGPGEGLPGRQGDRPVHG